MVIKIWNGKAEVSFTFLIDRIAQLVSKGQFQSTQPVGSVLIILYRLVSKRYSLGVVLVSKPSPDRWLVSIVCHLNGAASWQKLSLCQLIKKSEINQSYPIPDSSRTSRTRLNWTSVTQTSFWKTTFQRLCQPTDYESEPTTMETSHNATSVMELGIENSNVNQHR